MNRLSRLRPLLATALAAVLLSSQVLGLHYHRHVSGEHHGSTSVNDAAHATTWDPGAHFHVHASPHAGGHEGTVSAHPHQDVDVEVLGDLAAKAKKGIVQVAMPAPAPWAMVQPESALSAPRPEPPGERPQTFRLKPPSQAPPSRLS